MSELDDPPGTAGADPIDSTDPTVLRAEILSLRDRIHAAHGGAEVLRDRIGGLEERERVLADDNAFLHAELARSPLVRVLRALRRRIPGAP